MFPYNDAQADTVKEFASTVEFTMRAETYITHKKSKRTVEAITVALRFLEQNENFKFRHATFCECMGFAAEACCYAAAFGFKHLQSIEISEQSSRLGYVYLKLINKEAALTFSSAISRFQERMPVDAEIQFLDTEHVGDMDEGVIIQSFLNCCKMILPGAYAILVTKNPELNLETYNCSCLHLILPTTVAKGASDEGYLWLFKRLPDVSDFHEGEGLVPKFKFGESENK